MTTRSVLIYVKDKAACFHEFFRVLRAGGRVSLFEPNRLMNEFDPYTYWGGQVPEIADLMERLRSHCETLQPTDDPMLDFDERDLLRQSVDAGFERVHIDVDLDVTPAGPTSWQGALSAVGNPKIPSLGEALELLFTPEEAERFERHARPAIESGGRLRMRAGAWLSATKAGATGGERR